MPNDNNPYSDLRWPEAQPLDAAPEAPPQDDPLQKSRWLAERRALRKALREFFLTVAIGAVAIYVVLLIMPH